MPMQIYKVALTHVLPIFNLYSTLRTKLSTLICLCCLSFSSTVTTATMETFTTSPAFTPVNAKLCATVPAFPSASAGTVRNDSETSRLSLISARREVRVCFMPSKSRGVPFSLWAGRIISSPDYTSLREGMLEGGGVGWS